MLGRLTSRPGRTLGSRKGRLGDRFASHGEGMVVALPAPSGVSWAWLPLRLL